VLYSLGLAWLRPQIAQWEYTNSTQADEEGEQRDINDTAI